MAEVVLYSRTRCGLCDRARTTIERVRERAPFGFEEILIDGDEALEDRFGLRVPVVLIDGEEAFEAELTPEDLLEALAGRA